MRVIFSLPILLLFLNQPALADYYTVVSILGVSPQNKSVFPPMLSNNYKLLFDTSEITYVPACGANLEIVEDINEKNWSLELGNKKKPKKHSN